MSTIRSRRAGMSPEEAAQRPLYARALGLQYVKLSSPLSFVFFEGSIALGVLLALAELSGWWIVPVLPISIAAMVKLNDVIAGAAVRSGGQHFPRARGRAKVPRRPSTPDHSGDADEPPVHSAEQRARQSAARRYS